MITVYTKKNCFPCSKLKEWLMRQDIRYTEKPLHIDKNGLEFQKLQGQSVPLTIIEDGNETIQFLGNSINVKKHILKQKKEA